MSKNKSIFEILVQKTLDENIICSEDNIVVGVSGGPDSMFLLELLRVLKQNITFNIYVVQNLKSHFLYYMQMYLKWRRKKNNPLKHVEEM